MTDCEHCQYHQPASATDPTCSCDVGADTTEWKCEMRSLPYLPEEVIVTNSQDSPVLIIENPPGPIVTIHYDGTIEFGEGITPSDAAREMWDVFSGLVQRTYQGVIEERDALQAEVTRLRAARVREGDA